MIQVPLKDGGFDLEGILKEVNEDTSLVWLCNPNNPTGTYFNHESLDSFLSQVPPHVPVIIDEAYFEFVTAEDYRIHLLCNKNMTMLSYYVHFQRRMD